MMYVLISFRNVIKNLRKNVLMLTMISFGMTALYIFSGSNAHLFRQFRESVIHDRLGHFRLYARGFTGSTEGDLSVPRIERYSALAAELLRDGDIAFVAPRLHFSGIASGDDKSCIIRGFGGESVAESRMEYGRVSLGRFPDAGSSGVAVMGEKALAKCGLAIGDVATVLASMKNGAMTAADFTITGTRKGYGEGDRLTSVFMFADLAGVQQLLEAPDSVDTIIVHLADGVTPAGKEDAIRAFCVRYGLEYRRWDELALFYERSREVFSMNERILTTIILVISVFIIINTLSMAYLSRVRELGTMRAMGTTKVQIVRIIFNESFMLSLSGCTLGVLVASLVSLIVYVSGGIYHPPTVFNEESFYTFIQPEVQTIAGYFVLFLLVSAVASLVIAFRVLKISIADSLRWT